MGRRVDKILFFYILKAMIHTIRNIFLMWSSIIYRIKMFFNFTYRGGYIKLSQIQPPPQGENYYMSQREMGYDWYTLEVSLRKLGLLTPIRLVETDTFNENDERKYRILDGNHRVFILYKQLTISDEIRVHYRPRTKGEKRVDKMASALLKNNTNYLKGHNKNINQDK